MKKITNNIPELSNIISKYGVSIDQQPKYIVLGEFNSTKMGVCSGILGGAHCELYAHIILREIKKNGRGKVYRSEHHPDGAQFAIKAYMDKVSAIIAKQKN